MDRVEKSRFSFLKALIAGAWGDSQITAELLNVLKAYLRRVNVSEEESTALKSYLTRTIRDDEVNDLMGAFLSWHRTIRQDDLVALWEAISDLKEIDTDETDDVFLQRLRHMVEPFANAQDFMIRARWMYEGGGVAEAPASRRRADDLDEFVRSRIMHSVKSRMLAMDLDSNLSPKEVAYITSLSALLGRIAHADEDFSEEEKIEIAALLKESTTLRSKDIDVIMATIIDDTLKGLNLKMITRTFYNLSTAEQRETLLNCLFLVAGADGHIDSAEIDEIERIAVGLNMTHRDILRSKASAMEIVRNRLDSV